MRINNKRIFVFKLFQYLAPRYDRLNDWLSLGQHRRWRKLSLKLANPRRGSIILDLCCGSGDYMAAARERVGSTGMVIGLDFSPQMLELAKTKIQQSRHASSSYLFRADALQPPFQHKSIDLITIGFALRNVEDIQTLFNVSYHILRPGGKFLSLELSRQRSRLLWSAFRFYLRHVIPIFGRIILNARGPTHYLAHSIEELPLPEKIVEMFYQNGFVNVKVHKYMFGAISVFLAEKTHDRIIQA
jgi:demethylmenaquinone methyltransferase/2-methoxy-6-polyprenyl-1,4-benzoquinol methylase